jgi:penicillin V acylase-like amidase (Ntn superfamily)
MRLGRKQLKGESTMNKITIQCALCGMLAALVVGGMPVQETDACTRAVYLGPEDTIITVRSMDWKGDTKTNLWAFPRGMNRDGAAGPNTIRWTSKYGSLVAAGWDVGTADGMNEKGLVANMLYLVESEYVKPADNDKRKPLSISVWPQYVLDNFATVAEAVEALRREPFYVIPVMTPDGQPGQLHLSISDATGDSAIFQYLDGRLVIHHSREYQVMANSPTFSRQLALNAYWKEIGGTVMLPGTNRSADRFVRAAFYIDAIPKTSDNAEAVASAFSVIRNVSVPLGITTPGQPNISSTIWRTVADHKYKRYFFESARSPNVFWVNLADMDFAAGKPTKKLTLTGGAIFAGNAAEKFQPAEPFKFLPATVK